MTTNVLDREMFSEAEAARLLRVAQGTLHYWLEGGTQRGKAYRPVIRPEPTGVRTVTWAEFVEAALLRQYRKHRVPMAQLRAFIDELRNEYRVPYPLAHERPFVSGRDLVQKAQETARLDPELWLVVWANKQLLLTYASQSFVERVTWEDDIATAWRPHDDPGSPVRMAPAVRFGKPAIKGISTSILWEQVEEAGEDITEVADAFDLEVSDVRWALAYETSARSAQAA
jgi:uncharacterized protein (DUF433 family)